MRAWGAWGGGIGKRGTSTTWYGVYARGRIGTMPAPARYGDRRYPRLGILYPFTFGGRGSDGHHGSGLSREFQAYLTVETDDLLLDANKHPSWSATPQ